MCHSCCERPHLETEASRMVRGAFAFGGLIALVGSIALIWAGAPGWAPYVGLGCGLIGFVGPIVFR